MVVKPRRSCEVCWATLDWSVRSDARFCGAGCRQRAHRRNARLPTWPAEAEREERDDELESLREDLPEFWRLAADVVSIEYVSSVACTHCGAGGTWVFALVYPAGSGTVRFVFCSADCALDATHARRWPDEG